MTKKPDAPEMVRIEAGMFLMGSLPGEPGSASSETPRHEVRIKHAFALAKYPMTFGDWDSAIAAGAKLHAPDDAGRGRDRAPVVNVSWNDAKAYIKWLNASLSAKYRLPTEAEWEYACRAGSNEAYPHGRDQDQLTAYAWTAQNAENTPRPVGMLRPNAFGLHDMLGNMWEWCEDVWHDSYRIETSDGYQKAAPTDGSAWIDDGDTACRSLRGGSYDDVGPEIFRSADRRAGQASARKPTIGFRLAQTLD